MKAARDQLFGLRPTDHCHCRTGHCLKSSSRIIPKSSPATFRCCHCQKSAIEPDRKSDSRCCCHRPDLPPATRDHHQKLLRSEIYRSRWSPLTIIAEKAVAGAPKTTVAPCLYTGRRARLLLIASASLSCPRPKKAPHGLIGSVTRSMTHPRPRFDRRIMCHLQSGATSLS